MIALVFEGFRVNGKKDLAGYSLRKKNCERRFRLDA